MARHRLLLPLVAVLAFGLPAVTVSAGEATPATLGSDGVIYPRNSPEARQQHVRDEAFPVWGMLGLIAALAGGGFYLIKRGQLGQRGGITVHQRLAIEETRPLGNKQFLAVAAYGERKMLLAVCPGRIDFLCRLDDHPAASPAATVETLRRETVAD